MLKLPMPALSEYASDASIESDPLRFYYRPVVGCLYRNRVARCVSLLPTGERILEIGSGSGVSFLSLGEKFDEIHGIDLHGHGEELARCFAPHGLNLRLRQGDILNLPYEDESFDSALAISLHEHLTVDQQARAFGEVRRVLKDGGCYVVGVPGYNAMMSAGFRILGYDISESHLSTERQVLAAMRDVFDVDVERYAPSLWPRRFTMYATARGWKRGGPQT